MKVFDATKPVQTRDGRPARIICTDRTNNRPIVALIHSRQGTDEIAVSRYADGSMNPNYESGADLVNIPERKSEFWNCYNKGANQYHKTLGSAKGARGCGGVLHSCLIATVELVYEDDVVVDRILHA